jgi:hypothetical protein
VKRAAIGSGVAEILRSDIPLMRDLGLAADWQLISGDVSGPSPDLARGVQRRSSRTAKDQRP